MNQGTLGQPTLGAARYRGRWTVAQLPLDAAVGDWAWASDCRVFNGAGTQEGAGVGTGGRVDWNGTAWKITGTNVTASA